MVASRSGSPILGVGGSPSIRVGDIECILPVSSPVYSKCSSPTRSRGAGGVYVPAPPAAEAPSLTMWLCVIPAMLGPLLVGFSACFASPTFSASNTSKHDYDLDVAMDMTESEATWFTSLYLLSAGFGALLGGVPIDIWGKRRGLNVGFTFFLVGYLLLATASVVHRPDDLGHGGGVGAGDAAAGLPGVAVAAVGTAGEGGLSVHVMDAGARVVARGDTTTMLGNRAPEGHTDNTHNMIVLYAARLLMGLGGGTTTVAGIPYLTEISTLHHRGMLGAVAGLAISWGVMTVFGLGLVFHWRDLAWIAGGIAGVGLLGSLVIPESPQWLVVKRRYDEAATNLRRLRSDDSDVMGLLGELRGNAELRHERARLNIWNELRVAPRPRTIVYSCVLNTMLTLSGMTAIAMYASTILGEVYPDHTAKSMAFYAHVCQIPVTVVVFKISEFVPRKTLMVVSAVLFALGLGLLTVRLFGVGPDHLVGVGYFILATMWCVGMGPVPGTMTAEMTHPTVRGTIGAICQALNSFTGFLSTKTLLSLQGAFGGGAAGFGLTFVMYLALLFIAMVYIMTQVPETHRKTYEMIEAEMLAGQGYASEDDEAGVADAA